MVAGGHLFFKQSLFVKPFEDKGGTRFQLWQWCCVNTKFPGFSQISSPCRDRLLSLYSVQFDFQLLLRPGQVRLCTRAGCPTSRCCSRPQHRREIHHLLTELWLESDLVESTPPGHSALRSDQEIWRCLEDDDLRIGFESDFS